MYQISPICEETVTPHIGKRVCAVMCDGTCHYGILRGIGNGQLHLEEDGGLQLSALQKHRKRPKNSKAQTNAFYGYPGFGFGFGGGLALGLVASLFLLPFFFI